jgi:large subunit ribosomal protein L3
MKMPGQMGNKTAVINNLEIVKVDEENGRLFIKGAVPGAPNGIVVITK